ncbi:hypothetical protein NE237_021426 [Protea cynaroides]|uniref:Uncharacterized protein n=1 Tax=Protea cynaroides TaxID=273540 RepID=A0A9Q0K395_9MAGN|nr:hypothetical protein NE237_021426 [Protea cynaroides]
MTPADGNKQAPSGGAIGRSHRHGWFQLNLEIAIEARAKAALDFVYEQGGATSEGFMVGPLDFRPRVLFFPTVIDSRTSGKEKQHRLVGRESSVTVLFSLWIMAFSIGNLGSMDIGIQQGSVRGHINQVNSQMHQPGLGFDASKFSDVGIYRVGDHL